MDNVTGEFGINVFNDSAMREHLPKETYRQLQKTIKEGRQLDAGVASVVANAMKDWAVERGATHFTHWFQPMTGVTAEKHDSFITPAGEGRIIMEFSGKELVRGEPDASSFPSGGLRATFEARGYTAWDPNSYAFLKDGVLCVPTAFYSYGGEALDKKTPLLRSTEAVEKQALRVLRLFGNENVSAVHSTVGPEQEYFLIDAEVFEKRPDLIYTGRTLFGAKAPKGQELLDHYFGAIKPRVQAFMSELDAELWKLGVLAKTEHNETAPAQHELAPIFTTANIATDHNQLTMELMQRIARKYGMVCLLHEKPFAGINGSGKHNNWSLSTDTGVNLFEPGETPYENAQFLLLLSAVIKAVDDYQDLLRVSVASAGNDCRLGGNEAPPAIVSMFLGSEITEILRAIECGESYGSHEKEIIKVGVHSLPRFSRDTTDRNRTSPFAFTGNKFEFRMVGSSASIADANVTINTIVADVLKEFAERLEGAENFENALHELIRETIIEHRRIIFNGNGYGEEWIDEAKRRGLENLTTAPDCIPCLLKEKNVRLFTEHRVFSRTELESRQEIMLENYVKVIGIEAQTMIEMARRKLMPAISAFAAKLSQSAWQKQTFELNADYEKETAARLSELLKAANEHTKELEKALETLPTGDAMQAAYACRDRVLGEMNALRAAVDEAETLTSAEYWPYPSYGEILFSVK